MTSSVARRAVSLRPRFAGEGRLRLPVNVQVFSRAGDFGARGDVVGDLADAGYDPFERVASGLLLAEDFARVDLSNRKMARPWYQEHGVLDLAHFFPADDFDVSHHVREDPPFHDAQADVLQQQANVRWHLLSLVRLSDQLPEDGTPRAGWAPREGWDPRWAQPVLRDPRRWRAVARRVLELRGAHLAADAALRALRGRARARIAPRLQPRRRQRKRFTEQWWPTAHAAWQRIRSEDIPILWVPESDWAYEWSEYDIELPPSGRSPTGRLSADWWGLVELERRLLTPYVRRAAEYQVEIGRPWLERDLTREGESLDGPLPGSARRS